MEQIHVRVPDGTRARIQALGVPGGPADFVRWAVENALQEQERYRQVQGQELPSSYPQDLLDAYRRGDNERGY